jgi:2-dehydro-3-deoxyphosphogluconate aldolase / (4S)-4-hydroxy-2-oxoglutarate aldolase
MSRDNDLHRILDRGLVAIIRAPSGEQLAGVARALFEGGIDIIEVTFTVPRALEIIAEVRRDLGQKILLGAGSVLDAETARAALLAGAEFIVSPCVRPDVIQVCRRYGKVVMPGAFTPTEVVSAWEAGADIVKIFPADVGGPAYLKAIAAPLPQVRLMPTGGVNLDTLESFIRAGACAVGLGSALVDPQALRAGDMDRLRDLAAEYVAALARIRAGL